MGTTVELELSVHYGFVVFGSDTLAATEDLVGARGGQSNGLCGAAYRGALAMVTGLHTGDVPFTIAVSEAAPALDDSWEDVVEVSFEAVERVNHVDTFDRSIQHTLPAEGWFRARYCARGMDAAAEQDTRMDGEPALDRYLLQLWPAPPAPDRVLRRESERAAYWHGLARTTPPPPSPEELAAAAAREEAERARERERVESKRQLWEWGGTPPGDALRAGGDEAALLARSDRALADEFAGLDPQTLRRIAVWVARQACERAGPGPLNWDEALDALDRGHPLPPPFDDARGPWTVLYSTSPGDPAETVTTTIVVSGSQQRTPIHPPAAAVAAIRAAATETPLVAAIGALHQAEAALDDPLELRSLLRLEFDLG